MEQDRPLLTRLIVGRAGLGKTRLALELCSRATASGWVAGCLTPDTVLREQIYKGVTPTLIVIDYAETRHQSVNEITSSRVVCEVEGADFIAGADRW